LSRSALVSSAITSAPIAAASCVADNPTGPWPKIAMLCCPCKRSRCNAPHAVPVPHEIAAPAAKDNSSGSVTKVRAGHYM
jgi:hypothetical protein